MLAIKPGTCSSLASLSTQKVTFFLVNLDMKFSVSFCVILVPLTFASAMFLNQPVSVSGQRCEFPAIFNFGDSNSDTGGIAAAFSPPNPPNGETYDFHLPLGRDCDGRLIIDFIVKSFNLPYLSPYLDSLGTNFTHGANFATAGATIRQPTSIIPNGGFSPFFLRVQYDQFLQFMNRSQFFREQGGVFAGLMPKEEYFRNALYTFDIGQNDFAEAFFTNKSVQDVNASVPDIVNSLSASVKSIYNLGARSFWIHNTGPIGCLSYILTNFPSLEKDNVGCIKPFNEVCQYFNSKLKEAVAQLRNDLPEAAFTYIDVYSVKYSLYEKSKPNGFELPLVACCGFGGKYNFSNIAGCGQAVVVNGSQVIIGSCDRPSVRVNWDGIHYTDAANKFIFNQISTGAFSDPPIPLNMACRRTEQTFNGTSWKN